MPSFGRSAFIVAIFLAQPMVAVEPALPDLQGTEARVQEAVRLRYEPVVSSPSARTWGSYGMVLDAHRFVEAATIAYREAHALEPTDFRWSYYLAILLSASQPSEARAWFERAVAADPKYAPAHVLYAENLEGAGEVERARVSFERARELDSRNPLAFFGLGRIALRRGEVERAIGYLTRAEELGPPMQAVVATLARAHQRAGRPDAAARRAAEARLLPPMVHHRDERRAAVQLLAVNRESYLRRSRTYSEVGQLESALRELKEILTLEPDLAEAHLAAGGVYDLMGRAPEALASVQRALRLGADGREGRPLLASLLFKVERFDEAGTQARAVLEERPNDVHMLLLSSMAAAQHGDVASMIETLDRAFANRNGDPAMSRLMIRLLDDVGTMFADIGQVDVAARRMKQVLDLLHEMDEPGPVADRYRRRLESYRAQSPG